MKGVVGGGRKIGRRDHQNGPVFFFFVVVFSVVVGEMPIVSCPAFALREGGRRPHPHHGRRHRILWRKKKKRARWDVVR